MRLIFTALFLCISLFPARADIPAPDRVEDTLALLAAEFSAQGVASVRIDAKEQAVIWTNEQGEQSKAFPDNLHRDLRLRETDAERRDLLEMFVRMSLNPDIGDFSLEMAYLVVRHEDYTAQLKAMAAGDPAKMPLYVPFMEDLHLVWVLDAPEVTRVLTQGDLDDNGLELPQLAEAAGQNMNVKMADLALGGEGPLYFLQLDGYYESSAVLLG